MVIYFMIEHFAQSVWNVRNCECTPQFIFADAFCSFKNKNNNCVNIQFFIFERYFFFSFINKLFVPIYVGTGSWNIRWEWIKLFLWGDLNSSALQWKLAVCTWARIGLVLVLVFPFPCQFRSESASTFGMCLGHGIPGMAHRYRPALSIANCRLDMWRQCVDSPVELWLSDSYYAPVAAGIVIDWFNTFIFISRSSHEISLPAMQEISPWILIDASLWKAPLHIAYKTYRRRHLYAPDDTVDIHEWKLNQKQQNTNRCIATFILFAICLASQTTR